MVHMKALSIFLIYLLTSPGYCAGLEPSAAKSRKDLYDDILRPPPPPPPHLTPMRVHHHSHGQPRFQRHPRQPSYPGPPPFHRERYPHPPKPKEEQSIFQKMSSWLFPGNKDNSHQGSHGPPPSYGPPLVYGVPYISPGPPAKPGPESLYGLSTGGLSSPSQELLHNSGPSSTYGVPKNGPLPHQSYNVPSPEQTYSNKPSISLSQQKNTSKKNCNPCNLYPWIPVLTYQTQKKKSPIVGDQLTFNTNSILSPDLQKHSEPIRNNELSTQLTVPSDRPHGSYITPISNMLPSPPSIFPGEPFSLSHLALENNGPSFSKPLTNSYGTPIPSDTYGSPYPGTDDGTPLSIEINKDNLEHVGTNNIVQVSRPAGIVDDNPHATNLNIHKINQPSYPLIPNYEKGRNIQTLHPIPLPNLSTVPIPPLFNARPFNQIQSQYSNGQSHSSPSSTTLPNQSKKSNIQVVNSIPIAEFTSSVEYPISIIQSPLLDIDASKPNTAQVNNESPQRVNDIRLNPIVVQNENVKSNEDSYSSASGGNDHEFEDSEHDVVIYSTTESYTTTESQFLPTPFVQNRDKLNNENYQSPSTINPHFGQGYTSPIGDNEGSFSQASTINPNFHDYEDYSLNFFKPGDPDQLQAIDSPLLYLSPNVPHKESEPFKSKNHNSSHLHENKNVFPLRNSISSTIAPVARNITPGFRFIDNRAVPGRWPPPSTEEGGESTKKSKRIQIIIPYTSQKHPTPFQFSPSDVISSSGWIPMTDELGTNYGRKVPPLVANQDAENGLYSSNSLTDYHESSESKVVASSASTFNSSFTTKPIQSSDISPHSNTIPSYTTTPKQESKTSFDVMKLQQNIDEWTVQEFSKVFKKQQKASTISHLKRSKKIPDDYFTTVPSVLKTSNVLLTTINDLGSFFDNEAAGSFQHSVETDLNQPKTISNVDNEIPEEEPVTITSRPTYYISTTYPTTTYYTETTTNPPKTTSRHSWEKILTSISPLTKEKVYVVTPLPFDVENPKQLNNKIVAIQGRRTANITEPIITSKNSNILAFKSPRFLVRPTPGPTGSQRDKNAIAIKHKNTDSVPISGIDWLHSINNLIDTTTTESASRSFFGLVSVTAYTPPDGSAVQTYSGHSKVITVTPATEDKKTE